MIGTFTSGIEGGLPQPGRIGFVSQSGALGPHCFAAFRERGLGFGYWVTTGNECDIEFVDCLAFLAQDPDTDVIAAYIEGCRDGEKHKAALELARQNHKPVVILKVGQSEIGAKAAATHTASLAGANAVYGAVFKQYGACRVFSITELIETTYACLGRRFPAGKRIGLMTVSGGVGVMMADAAHALYLDVAPMAAEAQARMKQGWPPVATANPVDTTAQVTSDRALLGEFLEQMLSEGDYDILAVFLAHSGLVKSASDQIRKHIRPLRERCSDRLILVPALCTPDIRVGYEADGLPVFDDPTLAVQIATRLTELGRSFAMEGMDTPEQITDTHRAAMVEVPNEPINEKLATGLLRRAGVPSVSRTPEQSTGEAVDAVDSFGYPVVLKIVSPDIVHKGKHGGVLLDLSTADRVRAGYAEIIANVRRHAPQARIDALLVTPIIHDSVETLIGVQQNPTFGPVVAFGLGGIFVETLGDIALRPAPSRTAKPMR